MGLGVNSGSGRNAIEMSAVQNSEGSAEPPKKEKKKKKKRDKNKNKEDEVVSSTPNAEDSV